MAKTGDNGIGVKITSDPVPAGAAVVGAELHHAIRYSGAGVGFTFAIGANQWVYKLQWISGG